MPRTSTRLSSLPRAGQTGIQNFARAIKPGLGTLKSLQDGKKDLAPTPAACIPVSPSKKRKLHELENVQEGGSRTQGLAAKTDADPTLTPSKSLKFSTLSVSTPRSGHYASSSSPSARQTRASNDEQTVPSTPSKRALGKAAATPCPPCDSPINTVTSRPACVEELVRLHSAFLKAFTIHAAHRGVVAPADLRDFLPSVEQIWKKRKVVVKDLQRLLWVWEKGGESVTGGIFRLVNHGLGRVCLEKVAGRAEPVEEAGLQTRFEQAVDLLWDSAEGDESQVDFMATLGLAPIQESLTPFTTFRKGQQRLQDLKGGVIKMKMEALRTEATSDETSTAPQKTRDATTTRRQGLLERIKNKELRQAKLPPPPSKEALLRHAAAERVEEVAGVLALLRPAGYVGSGPMARMAAQRTPFCLDTIVRNVQDSTRNPISDKEVEACLEILSREDVAGHWVKVVVINQLKSVVLRSCGDVQLKDIGTKMTQLRAAWEVPMLVS
ncbi:hypothetical protein ASPCAL11059 [Aspergillus calidoustus]|uniref:DNA replication factor Cdt1 C-terminal domain-containing protein n=1 Tax=Aspergillus calidoustus TaxID=454130 RepID=A0A0U5G7G7_ASPCI|nr:hypothetical protein ASPCAL11059 [Aspergillus calidoustus]